MFIIIWRVIGVSIPINKRGTDEAPSGPTLEVTLCLQRLHNLVALDILHSMHGADVVHKPEINKVL